MRALFLKHAVLFFALALTLCGCVGTTPTERIARRYPIEVPRGAMLPIQVVVDDRRVEFTNTTGTVFGPSVLWLNQWYSIAIGSMGVGETISIPISRFVDEHGEQMRGGGFFATEAPERIVYAELRTGEALRGMPVVEPNTTSR